MEPDKIYVPSRFNLVDGLRVRESDTDVEYIRKDALLEWFNDNIKPLNILFGEIFIARVKDKLNSM